MIESVWISNIKLERKDGGTSPFDTLSVSDLREIIMNMNKQIEIDRLKTIMYRTRKPRIKKKLLKRILTL